MRLLVDTVTLLWAADKPHLLSNLVRLAIDDSGNDLFLSVTSVWEISVKVGSRKLTLPLPIEEFVASLVERMSLQVIDLTLEDVLHSKSLPLIHRDPFDRMLVCQALSRGLVIATPDPAIRRYAAPSIW